MSGNILPDPGTYLARRCGKMVVTDTSTGGVQVRIPVQLCQNETPWRGTHYETVALGDGTLRMKSIDNLKAIFGWDGLDFGSLMDIEVNGGHDAEFELADCKHETYQRENGEEVTGFKTGWLNQLGGGITAEPADRKELAAKWGMKLKAVGGGKAQKPTQAAAKPAMPTSKAPAKPAQAGPPSRRAGSPAAGGLPRSSSLEEVWTAFKNANPSVADDVLSARYYDAQDQVRPNANSDMKPHEWGQVLTILGL